MPMFDFPRLKKSNLANACVWRGYQKRSRDLKKSINRSEVRGAVVGTGGCSRFCSQGTDVSSDIRV